MRHLWLFRAFKKKEGKKAKENKALYPRQYVGHIGRRMSQAPWFV